MILIEETYKDGALDKSVFKNSGVDNDGFESKIYKNARIVSLNKRGEYKKYATGAVDHFPVSFLFTEGEQVPTLFKTWLALPSLANKVDFIPNTIVDSTDYSEYLPPASVIPNASFILSAKTSLNRLELYFMFNTELELSELVAFYDVIYPLPVDKRSEITNDAGSWYHHEYKEIIGDFILGSVQFEDGVAKAIKVYKFYRG